MTAPGEDPRLLVHAYVDGELDPAHALEFERQLAADPALAAERERIEALRRVIGECLPRESAPPALVRRIEAAVGLAAPARPASHPSWRALAASVVLAFFAAPARPASHPSWRALAASVVLALFIGGGGTWLALHSGSADTTANVLVASHVRSLMASQPIDVASSDSHTVKPWFNGRITEAPRVVDLAGEGFPLVGGRIDVIGRTPVATMVYRRRQHLISLSEIPDGHDSGATPRTIAGYNVLTWSEAGVNYWAVSDVSEPELDAFAKAFRTANP
jgi:anti-sigma factor RsiW